MNWSLLTNSLIVAVSTAALALALGFLAGMFVAGLSKPLQKILLVLSIAVILLPPFLVTNCWLQLFGTTGALKDLLPVNLFSLSGTVAILSLMYWPIAMFFTVAGWARLERAHLESDSALRGTALLRWLLVPSIRKEVMLAGTIIFILALNQFSVPAILQVKVLPAELWVIFNTSFDYAATVWLGWPLVVIPAVLLLVFRGAQSPWQHRATIDVKAFRSHLGGGWYGVAGAITLLVILLGLCVPVVQTLATVQTWNALIPALQAGYRALFNSIAIATMSASLSIVVSVLLWRHRGAAAMWLTFLLPGVILGIALIYLLNRPMFAWFYSGVGIVVVALALRYFSPGWALVAQAMRCVDRNLVDAARVEGARGWALFRHARLPRVLLPVLTAWYGVYLFSLWDVETLILIIPPGRETAAVRVFNLLHYGYNSQVNALCFWLLLAGLLPLSGYLLLRRIRGFGTFLAAGCVGLVLSGCSDKQGLQSKVFEQVQIIGSRGTGMGQFNKPRSLAVDRQDNLYVVDMTGRVQKFSPDGKYLTHWQMPQTDLGRPKGMNIDADGNVIVIEPHYSRVNHFSADGELVFQWGIHGTNDGQLAFPRAVAVNSRGDMYLSEFGKTERVQQFSPRGETFVRSFGQAGSQEGSFNRPEGLDVDPQDRIYVADSCNHRVQVFDGTGVFVKTFGTAGSAVGEMSYPYDIRIDKAGNRFVCEFGNSRIQVFDSTDQPFEIIGEAGDAPGQFANPWSIALDSKGNLYVADSQNHRVQKLIRKREMAAN